MLSQLSPTSTIECHACHNKHRDDCPYKDFLVADEEFIDDMNNNGNRAEFYRTARLKQDALGLPKGSFVAVRAEHRYTNGKWVFKVWQNYDGMTLSNYLGLATTNVLTNFVM